MAASQPCKYFNTPIGCRNGADCPFTHALSVKPPCQFFGTEGGCRFGDSCFYSHDGDSSNAPLSRGRSGGRRRSRRGAVFSRSRGLTGRSQPTTYDEQWYTDEQGDDTPMDISPPDTANYKMSMQHEMGMWGLKPQPGDFEEFRDIQNALKQAEHESEHYQYGTYEPRGRGGYTPHQRGRGGRPRGRR